MRKWIAAFKQSKLYIVWPKKYSGVRNPGTHD